MRARLSATWCERILALAIMIIALTLAGTQAQEPPQPAPTVESLAAQIEVWRKTATELGTELQQIKAERDTGYLEVLKSYNASLVDHYAHQAKLRDQARAVLGWQLFSAYVLLFVVVAVVGLGVWLSFLEVRSGLMVSTVARPASKAAVIAADPAAVPADPADPAEPADPAVAAAVALEPRSTQLKLTPTSLHVASAITGVIILVISLAFLYLFVDKVLELKPVDLITMHQPTAVPGAAATPAEPAAAANGD